MWLLLLTASLALTLAEDAPVARPSRFVSQFWTAYLNISYADEDRKVWHTERTETARYSAAGPVAKEAGGLAVVLTAEGDVEDNSGCTGPFSVGWPTTGEGWVAVVKRGGCTFNTKIANAAALNASAVLVYDDRDSDRLQSMKVERFRIPAALTYQWKGQDIVKLIKKVGTVYILLQEASHCVSLNRDAPQDVFCTAPQDRKVLSSFFDDPSGKGGHNSFRFWQWNVTSASSSFEVEKRTSVLFVSVSFLVLMLISLAWLVFYYLQRFRYLHARDKLERRLCSQAKRALATISTSVLRKDDLELRDFADSCAICIESYRVADVVRILPCGHRFHRSCIDQWLLEKRTCPMCKMDILKHCGGGAAAGGGTTTTSGGAALAQSSEAESSLPTPSTSSTLASRRGQRDVEEDEEGNERHVALLSDSVA